METYSSEPARCNNDKAQLAGPAFEHRDYLLAELRCAALRARLAHADIEAVGLALKYNMVTPEHAVALLWDAGANEYLGVEPPKNATPEIGSAH
jgi:hypothetical protein